MIKEDIKPINEDGQIQLPSIDKAGGIAVQIIEKINPKLPASEQALFVAGFQEAIKYVNNTIKAKEDSEPIKDEELIEKFKNEIAYLLDNADQTVNATAETCAEIAKEYAAQSQQNNSEGWIDADIKPLVTRGENGNWTCTKEGDEEFLAAVPYYDERVSGKELWWVRHCVIEDKIGLCVVGSEENEPAGWEIESVKYYYPIPKLPNQ